MDSSSTKRKKERKKERTSQQLFGDGQELLAVQV
jgi:hypothetical protein